MSIPYKSVLGVNNAFPLRELVPFSLFHVRVGFVVMYIELPLYIVDQ